MGDSAENDTSDSGVLQDFFISYAVENWAQAKWIHEQLEAHGYRTTLAGRDFSAGNNIALEVNKALKTSARMIAVMSPDYLASPYTQAEWAAVFHRDPNGEQGLLIPVLVQPCEVDGLLAPILHINLIDFIGKDDQQALKRLLRGIRVAPRSRSLAFSPSRKETSLLSSRLWHVPFPRNPLFTGREDLLEQLHQKLTTGGGMSGTTSATIAALTHPQALKGLGGIGKTQLAIEYAYRYQDDYPHTFWINAATEETLITSFVAIADLLPSFPAKGERDQNKVVEAVKHWLEHSQTRWLLIFDNADDIPLALSFLPKAGPGHILLTTRAHAIGSIASSIEVKKMSLMEGTCLLLRRVYGLASRLSSMQVLEYASVETVNEAGNIVAVLDYLPLALDQAGAYIEETGCGFAEYLEVYQDHRKELLARRGTQATKYPDSVATTWSLSFQKVQQACPAAAELLRLCAFLAPDAIPEELIQNGASRWNSRLQRAATDTFAFDQMIEELLKFSLVERLVETQNFRMLSVHRLVQAVLIDTMRRDTQRRWAERVVLALDDIFLDANDVPSWPRYLRYLSQAQMCATHIEQYRLMAVEAARLLNQTGMFLVHHAIYPVAQSLFQRALAMNEHLLGDSHPDIASSLNNLAVLYRTQGKYAEAEPLYQRALAIREQQLGPDHPRTALSLNNLATCYQTQEKYAEAEPLYQRALAISEQRLGPDHPETARYLSNLAGIYRVQKKYAEAEPLFVRSLAIREQQLGANHPDTAHSLANLALLYQDQKKYAKAESLYQRALAICKQQLEPDHPTTAQYLSNLATLYANQKKYARAEPLYQQALAIRERHLGPDHPQTVLSLNDLADIYIDQRKYAEAEPLYQRMLVLQEQQLGPDHLKLAHGLSNLALLYTDQGRYDEAEPLLKRALRFMSMSWVRNMPLLARYANSISASYKPWSMMQAQRIHERTPDIEMTLKEAHAHI